MFKIFNFLSFSYITCFAAPFSIPYTVFFHYLSSSISISASLSHFFFYFILHRFTFRLFQNQFFLFVKHAKQLPNICFCVLQFAPAFKILSALLCFCITLHVCGTSVCFCFSSYPWTRILVSVNLGCFCIGLVISLSGPSDQRLLPSSYQTQTEDLITGPGHFCLKWICQSKEGSPNLAARMIVLFLVNLAQEDILFSPALPTQSLQC